VLNSVSNSSLDKEEIDVSSFLSDSLKLESSFFKLSSATLTMVESGRLTDSLISFFTSSEIKFDMICFLDYKTFSKYFIELL
jgi:hypothetical protein